MKTKLLGAALALGLAVTPLASIAGGVGGGNANSNWTIYGWQNYSYEFVDNDQVDRDRISANAANIGFSSSIDTGVSVGGQAVKANMRCESFAYYNNNTSSGLCNRNSKLGLSGVWGEVMFGHWLLPYNEMVAAWVDPFYDAGSDSHTSIMGNVGFARGGGNFYNGGNFQNGGPGFDYAGIYSQAFNRRQEDIIQWMSPNWSGFTARFAMTSGRNDETDAGTTGKKLDPRIWSTGIAYTTDIGESNLWVAATYEKHDEWGAFELNSNINGLGGEAIGGVLGDACTDSDDDAWRLATRWIQPIGGMSLTLSAMYEQLSYDTDCENAAGAALTHLYTDTDRDSWMVSGKLDFAGPLDLRFSYMSADELDCGNGDCGAATNNTDDDTDAIAYNIGLFYTMPAGTELRLTYTGVDNEDNANYDLGIVGSSGGGAGAGDDTEMFAVGLVQWF